MAEAYDVAIAPHCPLGPIAFAASLHVGLSTANFTILVREPNVKMKH